MGVPAGRTVAPDGPAVEPSGTGAAERPSPFDADALLELHRRVVLIRRFEERVVDAYAAGDIPGFVHTCLGEEATAVGACWPLRTTDVITSTHRGHGHCLAKGVDPTGMFAELMGRDTGTCRGRGGSMHIADPSLGMFGANGIVGAGLPIATGAAVASKLRHTDSVAVAFFGDGAVAQGAFHESANLAALWRLPIVFFCENNGYSEFSPAEEQHPSPLEARAFAYGMRFVGLDGSDVAAVAGAMAEIVAAVRSGGGPVLVEAKAPRWRGHYEGDPQRYRDETELTAARQVDPVEISRGGLRRAGVPANRIEAVEAEVAEALSRAEREARAANEPEPSSLYDFVYARRNGPTDESPLPSGDDVFRTMDAIKWALEQELSDDESVFLAGIDVGRGGNVFGITRGLYDRWPDRVLDTPISETAILGLGNGAAMAGMKPVVEIMYLDFVGVCFDQLMNQAAKMRFMTGGNVTIPLTVRTQFGAGRSSGSQHSQSLEVLLAHIPGLSVVMPSTPAEYYGLLRTAIQDPNPVVFIEHRHLYGHKGLRPPVDYRVPLGKARVVRPGSDVTVVSIAAMVHEAVAAAAELEQDGISAEVIDLRCAAPLDLDTVLESVIRTSRLVVAHEAVATHGIGAEVAAAVADAAFWHLDAPIARVGAAAAPAPYSPPLERTWLPGRDDIVLAARRTVAI
jgi:2-oxoisovalerate dehydrogenase E1 component